MPGPTDSPFDPGTFAPPPQLHPTGRKTRPENRAPRPPKPGRRPGRPRPGRTRPGRGTGERPVLSRLRRPLRGTVLLAVALLLGLVSATLLHLFVLEAFAVPSSSMDPTVHKGDRILVEKLSYTLGEPQRGQVVVFKSGPGWEGDGDYYVKRVIAVAGDKIRCCDAKGRVSVNGSPLDEPYLRPGSTAEKFAPVTVPDGTVFVMGDNRNDSYDSRFRGPVPVNRVVGRVVGRFWPLDHLGGVPRY